LRILLTKRSIDVRVVVTMSSCEQSWPIPEDPEVVELKEHLREGGYCVYCGLEADLTDEDAERQYFALAIPRAEHDSTLSELNQRFRDRLDRELDMLPGQLVLTDPRTYRAESLSIALKMAGRITRQYSVPPRPTHSHRRSVGFGN
jgi:hypothetical protein